MTSRKRPRTVAPNSSHTALTDRDTVDMRILGHIITLNTILPPRTLHPAETRQVGTYDQNKRRRETPVEWEAGDVKRGRVAGVAPRGEARAMSAASLPV